MSETRAPGSGETILELDSVTRSYGAVAAVRGVSFALKRGEILTLLGPSGCGKTTTLRMAIGLERADGGTIRFNGAPVDSPRERIFVPPNKRGMGMVFQSYAIWPHMSVFENIAYPLRVRRLPRAEIAGKVERVLDLVGLAGLGERPGTRLSGGQQQRVAVARCLVFDPDLLLMDEPFSNLDAKLREQMRVEVKLLQRRLGLSVLFVTHDQGEALALSDRIAVMHQGRIEQLGPPVDLYRQPGSAVVRDFLGRTVVFKGVLEAREGDSAVVRLQAGVIARAAGTDQANGAAIGSEVLVASRPERIALVAPGQAGSAALRGTIMSLQFLGDRFEANIELAGGEIAAVIVPPESSWREGEAVALALDPAALQLWPR